MTQMENSFAPPSGKETTGKRTILKERKASRVVLAAAGAS